MRSGTPTARSPSSATTFALASPSPYATIGSSARVSASSVVTRCAGTGRSVDFTSICAGFLMVRRLLFNLFSQPVNLSLQLFFIVVFTCQVLVRLLQRCIMFILKRLGPIFMMFELQLQVAQLPL